jgi:UDP:flavonoid glycosyltransferase YjiC (YdhE family)
MPDHVSVKSIGEAVGEVIDDPSYAAAAAKLKIEIDRLPGPSAVVEEVLRRVG